MYRNDVEGIAIVVVPSRLGEKLPNTPFPMYLLNSSNEWFITTPCTVKLMDDVCVHVME